MGQSPRESEFWEQRFREGRTRWDLGGPTPVFVQLLEGKDAPPPGKILVPGCGNGHDVLLFARHGFEALGVDFAPTAVENATRAAREAGLADKARFERANIFDVGERHAGQFDYVLERACFCAIDPVDRERYVETMARVLKPGGRLFALFFRGPKDGGPPFAASEEELRASFAPHFEFERLDPTVESDLGGGEQFGILRRT